MKPVIFQLTSSAIANLAAFTLSFVILLYVLSLRNKSKDCRIFITALIINYVLFKTIAFFFDSFKHSIIATIHSWWLVLLLLSHIRFSYAFGGNPFRREMYGVLLIAMILLIFGQYQDNPANGTWPTYLIGHFWLTLVWLRKAEWAVPSVPSSIDLIEKRPIWKRKVNRIIHELETPSNRQSSVFRAFAGYCFIWALFWVELNIRRFGGDNWIPRDVHTHVFHTIFIFANTYFAVVYLNFATEKTSFQAKLIGVVLCIVLALLAQIPFVMFGNGNDPDENVRKMLLFFVILIVLSTSVILLILPPFLKFILLKPLNEIGSGVESVNEGDLINQVEVEVNDEFGLLAQNFNRMTKSLHEYNWEMENLVAKRTTELRHSLEALKFTQTQLIQKEKLASLGELTAGIAHEIQNPLNFVNNFSELSTELIDEMNEEIEKGDTLEVKAIAGDLKQNLEKINHHGKRASSIVKGMLEHSRMSTGESELTDINQLADEYLRLSYHGLRAKDSSFNSDYELITDESLPKTNVVPQEIGRVLLNLFNNAFYAVNERSKLKEVGYKPKVTVTTKAAENQSDRRAVEVQVQDNGTGMSDATQAKIFQPFFTTKPTGEGTGLGLSLAYDIVTKGHGGEIRVETKEGEGTDFFILLPL